jgi:methionine-gamma-lyase
MLDTNDKGIAGTPASTAEGTMSKPTHEKPGFSTRAIHHAYDAYAGTGDLNPPIHLSSTYTFPTVEDGSARFAGEQQGFVYSRVGNPTTVLLG